MEIFNEENLSGKTNAELCEILENLGGEAPASRKFRTKAAGIAKILERYEQVASERLETQQEVEAEQNEQLFELPAPETRRERFKRQIANARSEQTKRIFRKKLRRLNTREVKARKAREREIQRAANGVKARRAAAKATRNHMANLARERAARAI